MSQTAADGIRRWREDPAAFVVDCFGVQPDPWQLDVLRAFPSNPRQAMKACKGPGKTAILAWLCWNFLATRPHPKIAATSITWDNLSDGLWTEMAKWQKKSTFLTAAFSWTKTRIFSREHPETWWMSARTWPRGGDSNAQADTLAGLHADYLMFVLDEVGGIPDAVMAAAEAGLANVGAGGHEAHIVMAGNPTHLAGPLYRAVSSERSMWHVTEITADPDDPKRTPRVNPEWARDQIKKYGRDNPWVLVNVFGKFPPSSLNALLSPEDVREAMARQVSASYVNRAARIIGVDVAREGNDSSVIFRRQGVVAFEPQQLRNVDSLQGAGSTARHYLDWQADGVFIDNTGGFGGGWIDQLNVLQVPATPVHFAGKATDPRYFNKRAEMWMEMANWIKSGGALPQIPELVEELTAATYFFTGDKFQLISKEKITEIIGRSPDFADSLGLTFAYPVVPGSHMSAMSGALTHRQQEHDPYASMR